MGTIQLEFYGLFLSKKRIHLTKNKLYEIIELKNDL